MKSTILITVISAFNTLTASNPLNPIPNDTWAQGNYPQLQPPGYIAPIPGTKTTLATKKLTYSEQETYTMVQQLTQALAELQKKPELQQAVLQKSIADLFTTTKQNLTTLDRKNNNSAYVSWFLNIVDLIGKLTGVVINQQTGEITFLKQIPANTKK